MLFARAAQAARGIHDTHGGTSGVRGSWDDSHIEANLQYQGLWARSFPTCFRTQRMSPLSGGIAMLVLTRRLGESIIIDDDIVVTVLEVHGDKIRLGVTAPKHVAVHREEVYRRLQCDFAEAAQIVMGSN